MKDKKRLHIIKHPSIAGEFNKRLSCTEKKIKSKIAAVKLEEGESSSATPPKKKGESKKKPEKRKCKSAKATSEEPQTQPEPAVKLRSLLPLQRRLILQLQERVPGTSAKFLLRPVLGVQILILIVQELMVSKQVC